MGIIASVDWGLVDRGSARSTEWTMERSDVGTTGRLLFSVKSALAKPACGYGFKRLVGYTDAFMYGLRRGDIPTGGNLTKVSTYSNSNDTTRHKQHGVRHTEQSRQHNTGSRVTGRAQLPAFN